MEVTLMEMLDARENRVRRQRALLDRFGAAMICYTMNIAGPVKNSPRIRQGYALGRRLLGQQLSAAGIKVLHFEEISEKPGNEAIFVVDCAPEAAKAVTVLLEDETPMGRLFDMDVLRPDGSKADRQELGKPGRTCLICGGPAQSCARSRTHTVAQLQEKTAALIDAALEEDCRQTVARLACQALLYEVAATPKPGLVDRENSGSHRDMDVFTFLSSASALTPYFARCAQIGRETRDLPAEQTFAQLRAPGMLAEGQMLHATDGVNTHKGAIFSMGILCGALGRLDREIWGEPEKVLAECAAMTKDIVRQDFENLTPETAKTAGRASPIT